MSTRDLARIGIPILIVVIIISVVVVAKYFPPNGKLVCEYASAPGDPHADYIYTANFSFWKVKKVETRMVLTSQKKEVLEEYKKNTEEAIQPLKELKHYKNEIILDGKQLTSIVSIDYEHMNESELSAIEGNASKTKKSISIRTLKRIYTEIGANCSYQ